jgi:hypothetical protein
MILAQKIVASSVFLVTEIIDIENHQLDSTFFHIAFDSQSLLKPISEKPSSDNNWRIRESGHKGVEWEPIKIP